MRRRYNRNRRRNLEVSGTTAAVVPQQSQERASEEDGSTEMIEDNIDVEPAEDLEE